LKESELFMTRKLLSVTIVIFALVFLVAAQKKREDPQEKMGPIIRCHLPLARAPELRGFSLGMPQEKITSRFPGVTIDRTNEFGEVKLQMNIVDGTEFRKTASPKNAQGVQVSSAADPADGRLFLLDHSRFPDLRDVRHIDLRLLDGRLAFVQLGYNDAVKWEDLDEFIETISETLHLPDEWEYSSDEGKELQCDGFIVRTMMGDITTDIHAGPVLSVEDRAAVKTAEQRGKERDEKRRKAFKP
jgi:hypothetical protein